MGKTRSLNAGPRKWPFVVLSLFLWTLGSNDGHSGEKAGGPIRLNTWGYLSAARKVATVAEKAGDFQVVRLDDRAVVYRGTCGEPRENRDTGELLAACDFSSVTEPGKYVVEITGLGRSAPFEIGESIYVEPFHCVMRGMYLWRCGTSVDEEFGGDHYFHAACHLADASMQYVATDGGFRSAVRGWHDAGDYNKYVANGAMTAGMLLRAWEDFAPRIKRVSLKLPESGELPEFLAEIRWELDWLLAMQADDGSVSCKLSTLDFCDMIQPEEESATQYFTPWSSDATADFVAVMAQAARSFAPYAPREAQAYRAAAERGYHFLAEHPENHRSIVPDFKTGRYQSRDGDERLWAASELWRTGRNPAVLKDLEERLRNLRRGVDFSWDWGSVNNLGVLAYLSDRSTERDQALVDKLQGELLGTADRIVQVAQEHGYERPLGERYFWGCNGVVARQAFVLEAAFASTGEAKYHEKTLAALNHLFGRNYYGRSFVTRLGYDPPHQPHDRRSISDEIAEPWPGYLIGGPHPTAVDWQDKQEDYRTNEIAINWNGALIYALASVLSAADP